LLEISWDLEGDDSIIADNIPDIRDVPLFSLTVAIAATPNVSTANVLFWEILSQYLSVSNTPHKKLHYTHTHTHTHTLQDWEIDTNKMKRSKERNHLKDE